MQTKFKWTLPLLVALSLGLAAEEPSGGWRKLGEPAAADALPPSTTLTLPVGSWIKVRVDEALSSDRNQPGDIFTASLAQPLVAGGRVIARRGQTVGGAVAVAEKAGRRKGTSRLGLELTEVSLVDGRQIPVKTRLMEYRGDTSVGRDIGAIGTTTGAGAAIGAAVDGGFGAGTGAIAGAAASTIGVLMTRGKPTEVYPEAVLTFRLEDPLTIPVESSGGAFQTVAPEDYESKTLRRPAPSLLGRAPMYYGGYYPPFFYGPSFFFYSGPHFYGRRGYYRRW